jgi:hypothetical protein
MNPEYFLWHLDVLLVMKAAPQMHHQNHFHDLVSFKRMHTYEMNQPNLPSGKISCCRIAHQGDAHFFKWISSVIIPEVCLIIEEPSTEYRDTMHGVIKFQIILITRQDAYPFES